MALLKSDVSNPLGTLVATESQGLASSVTQIDDSGGTIYQIEINNSGNQSDVYLKLYQGSGNTPTVGSTAPDHIIKCLSASTVSVAYPDGLAYTVALFAAVVSGSGGTEGTTDPTGTVKYRIRYTT